MPRPPRAGAPKRLPALPSIVSRILRLRPSSERYTKDLLVLLQEDPQFAAGLLATANAVTEGIALPVTSLHAALTRLGGRRVAILVTAMGVARAFAPRTDGQRRTWEHSVEVAVGARFLSGALPAGEVDFEDAFLAGLLHDVGRFLLFREEPEEFASDDARGWSAGAGLLESERAAFGTDHAVVGSRACRAWGLPDDVVAVVGHHHVGLGRLGEHPPEVHDAIAVVQLADVLSLLKSFHTGFREGDGDEREAILARSWRRFAPAGRWCTPDLLAEAAAVMDEETGQALADLGLARD